jgi:hypothetical protein
MITDFISRIFCELITRWLTTGVFTIETFMLNVIDKLSQSLTRLPASTNLINYSLIDTFYFLFVLLPNTRLEWFIFAHRTEIKPI